MKCGRFDNDKIINEVVDYFSENKPFGSDSKLGLIRQMNIIVHYAGPEDTMTKKLGYPDTEMSDMVEFDAYWSKADYSEYELMVEIEAGKEKIKKLHKLEAKLESIQKKRKAELEEKEVTSDDNTTEEEDEKKVTLKDKAIPKSTPIPTVTSVPKVTPFPETKVFPEIPVVTRPGRNK